MAPLHPSLLTTVGLAGARCVMLGVRLGLFEALRDGPIELTQLARQLGVAAHPLSLVTAVLTEQGILVPVDGKGSVGLDERMAPLLLAGEPDSAADLVRFDYDVWRLFDTLEDRLRSSAAPSEVDVHWNQPDPAFWDRYLAALDAAAGRTPFELVRLVGESLAAPPTRILDLGGGSGIYAAAFARRFPTARVRMMDLPPAVAAFRRSARHPQVEVVEGDMRTDPLGRTWDLVSLVNVAPHLQAEERQRVLLRASRSLSVNGAILVMSPSPQREGTLAAAAGNLMFWLMCGRPLPSKQTLRGELAGAGFGQITSLILPSAPDTVVLLARLAARPLPPLEFDDSPVDDRGPTKLPDKSKAPRVGPIS